MYICAYTYISIYIYIGHELLRIGKPCYSIFMVLDGLLSVWSKNGDKQLVEMAQLGEGKTVGEVCSVLQCDAVCGSVWQCVAVCCSRVLQMMIGNSRNGSAWKGQDCRRNVQYVAVCCNVLQCVALCCIVLQCVAVSCSVLQSVAVCCSV